jgi:hypothetical protein
LTPEQLAALEAEALDQAEVDARGAYEDRTLGPFRKTLLYKITEEHIRKILRRQVTTDGASPVAARDG